MTPILTERTDMTKILTKFGDLYMDWSTSSDGPLTPLLTLPQLKRHLVERYGRKALDELPERLDRVEKFGTSSLIGLNKEALLETNTCGPNGTRVETEEEMIRLFGPNGEQPGFEHPTRLDIEEPLKLRVRYGTSTFSPKVTKIVQADANVVFAYVSVPDVPGPFPILFERDGTILTSNFEDMEVVYDRD